MPPNPFGAPATPSTSTAGPDQLAAPPPSMAVERGPAPPAGLQDLVPPPVPAGQIPEPLRLGAAQITQQIGESVDALAQLFPEFAANFGVVRIALEQAMQAVAAASGSPTAVTPTDAGPGFPGGGLSSAPTV